MKYNEQLKSPKWQKLKLQKLEAANWQCEICANNEIELNVHHSHYREGAAPWEHELDELKCLCRDCHTLAHLPSYKIKAWVSAELEAERAAKNAAYISSIQRLPMHEGVRQLCRLSLINPETKEWLRRQNSLYPFELGEGGDLLGKILESSLSLHQPFARVAFMATLPRAEEIAICELNLDRPQENSLFGRSRPLDWFSYRPLQRAALRCCRPTP